MDRYDFCLITSNVYFDENLIPYRINDLLTIKRANEQHISIFQSNMEGAKNYFQFHNFLDYGSPCFILNSDNDPIPAPTPRWWLVSFADGIDHTETLNMAGELIRPKINFAMQGAIGNENDHYATAHVLLRQHEADRICRESWMPYRPQLVTPQAMANFKLYFGKLEGKDVIHETKYAMKLFLDSMSLDMRSTLKTLSYFSVIECLITRHGPTITTQILNNIKPIMEKSDTPPDTAKYFGVIEYKKLWETLYDIRSRIAHGSTIKLKPFIKDLGNVNSFLELVIIEIAKIALTDPDLVRTLREKTKY